ncbi:MAG TPA: translation initiation factor IF-2 [Hyphomicrobiaceae bacterium]|nr:translation initiation factor IF-2 [Hyphomicrobiaceae bacterium]
MSEPKETTDKTVHPSVRKPLSLKRTVESGHVQQKFSHGRSKSVVVEKRKKRTLVGPETEEAAGRAGQREAASAQRRPQTAAHQSAEAPATGAAPARTLSEEERAARAKALAAAQVRSAEEERLRSERERQAAAKPEAPDKRGAVEHRGRDAAVSEAEPSPQPAPAPNGGQAAATLAVEEESGAGDGAPAPSQPPAKPAEEAAPPRPVGMTRPMIVSRPERPSAKVFEPAKPPEPETAKRTARPSAAVLDLGDEEEARAKRKGSRALRGPAKGAEGRVRGKLTITNAFDESQRQRSLASLKRRREREKRREMGILQPRDKIVREVVIPEAITIQELANRMSERAVDVIKFLMKSGEMHTINDVIDADTAELIVQEFGHTAKRVSEADVEEGFIGERDPEETLQPRAPVVTIMGHVDHGKTSLLDAIRSTNVAAGEAGGITQHIGAYQVTTDEGHKITFIDTPGHEAFTAMRARGAKVTDIVVLVVAADDGVMPQTVEAINHAKAAGVPLIVAINKIDKPDADPNRVRTELLQHGVVVESMSGETLEVPVSALKRTNLDKLLEAIVLQAELLELKANPNRTANGHVIEAKLERGRGPVGTLLVERGTLRVGDIVVAGTAWGRVRALIDDKGKNVDEAGPSVPVEMLGFDSAPEAGDEFSVVESEARAREITDYRVRKRREALGSAGTPRTLEQMMQQLKDAGRKEFPLVIKGDVQGSVEAIVGALRKISTDEVEARIVHAGVGGITESDIALATASKAVVIGFNVRANVQAKASADRDGVEIRYYDIIYDLVDDVRAAMSGLLAPTVREIPLGSAEVLQVFNISKVGKVAGCRVREGRVERGAKVRLIRDNVVILKEGRLSSLKRFKDEVREVPAGQECGMAFENYQDIREGDIIECFNVETVKRTL